MALSINMMRPLAGILKPGMRVASLGYPDLIAPLELILPLLGDKAEKLTYRDDSPLICRRHGLKERQIPDAESFFALLDCDLDVYDVVRERGGEIILDLNYGMPSWVRAFNYDIVLDIGTIEHCFNIAQAAFNMAGMVKLGGHILHENPFNWGNHGFYSLNPTWYADFYAANGFKVLELMLVTRDGRTSTVPATQRFVATGEEYNALAVAQRVEDKIFALPTQTKYAKLIAAQTAPAAGVRAFKEVANG